MSSNIPSNYYVDNDKLVEALMQHKKNCRVAKRKKLPEPLLTNFIGECFLKIAEGFSHKYQYNNYPHVDEMKSDAVENCLLYFRNFDSKISKSAFAYFTQITYYAFLRRIQKEKKQLYARYKLTQQMGILDEQELLELEDGTQMQFELYSNISEFIEKYEEARKKKKEKLVKKPKGIEKHMR